MSLIKSKCPFKYYDKYDNTFYDEFYGYKNENGKLIKPYKYTIASDFYDGVAVAGTEEELYILDETGQIIKKMNYNNMKLPIFVSFLEVSEPVFKYGLLEVKIDTSFTAKIPIYFDKTGWLVCVGSLNYLSQISELISFFGPKILYYRNDENAVIKDSVQEIAYGVGLYTESETDAFTKEDFEQLLKLVSKYGVDILEFIKKDYFKSEQDKVALAKALDESFEKLQNSINYSKTKANMLIKKENKAFLDRYIIIEQKNIKSFETLQARTSAFKEVLLNPTHIEQVPDSINATTLTE